MSNNLGIGTDKLTSIVIVLWMNYGTFSGLLLPTERSN